MKIKLNNKLRKYGIIICIIFVVLALVYAGIRFVKTKDIEKENYEVEEFAAEYSATTKPIYEININENEYIDKNKTNIKGENNNKKIELNKGYSILKEFIQNIEIKFNYKIEEKNTVFSTANYKIKGNLVVLKSNGKDVEDTKMIEKEYTFKEGSILEKNSDTESVILNLPDFESVISSVESRVNENLVAFLDIWCDLDVEDAENNKEESHNNHIVIEILDKSCNIKMYEEEVNSEAEKEEIVSSNKQYIISIFIIFASGCAAWFIMFETQDSERAKEYDGEKKNIKREYGEYLVQLKEDLKIKDENIIINILNLDEMVNLSDKLSSPILFFDKPKSKEIKYYIVKGNIVYSFKFKE